MASYADVASKGPKQTPEEAAAPQPPVIETSESASTSSLIDVDTPSVRTVPSDFAEQDVQTETQAERIGREEEAAKEVARRAADAARRRGRKADSWMTRQLSSLSDNAAGAVVAANALAVVGISGFLGYRAWGLYEKGRLTWQSVGLGLGILGAVGAVEGIFGGYLYKAKGKKN